MNRGKENETNHSQAVISRGQMNYELLLLLEINTSDFLCSLRNHCRWIIWRQPSDQICLHIPVIRKTTEDKKIIEQLGSFWLVVLSIIVVFNINQLTENRSECKIMHFTEKDVPSRIKHLVPVWWQILVFRGLIIDIIVIIIFSDDLLVYLWIRGHTRGAEMVNKGEKMSVLDMSVFSYLGLMV